MSTSWFAAYHDVIRKNTVVVEGEQITAAFARNSPAQRCLRRKNLMREERFACVQEKVSCTNSMHSDILLKKERANDKGVCRI